MASHHTSTPTKAAVPAPASTIGPQAQITQAEAQSHLQSLYQSFAHLKSASASITRARTSDSATASAYDAECDRRCLETLQAQLAGGMLDPVEYNAQCSEMTWLDGEVRGTWRVDGETLLGAAAGGTASGE
ncbi:MAG: hypothetical protein Q9159_004632, partial [Coniocarpon cinnabarinum]